MDLSTLRARLSTVVAIPVTPFKEPGGLDAPALSGVVHRLISAGIEVVTPNGNTGEFYAMTEAETREALDLTISGANGRAVVVAGIGHSVKDAVAQARYAADAGAQAVMIHQPVHPYVSLGGWIDYHQRIAESVPELGVVLYVRNPRIEGAQIAELQANSPNVIGVKYAVPDPVRFATVAREAGLDQFTWIAGLAELSAPGYFATGATGFTSGLVNVAPALSLELLDTLRAGDYPAAMKVWERLRPFEELRARGESENNVSVVKEALAQLGVCRPDVRPPSRVLPEPDREAIGELLSQWGLV